MFMKNLRHTLKLWIFGRCESPDGQCTEPGTLAFYPQTNIQPIWMCPRHRAIARYKVHRVNGQSDL